MAMYTNNGTAYTLVILSGNNTNMLPTTSSLNVYTLVE